MVFVSQKGENAVKSQEVSLKKSQKLLASRPGILPQTKAGRVVT